jgi:putative ABC transport system permease protein
MKTGVPLAWLQLTRDKRRFAAALAGIAFAVSLMLTQLGFEDALTSTSGLVQSLLDADLVLISPKYQFVISPRSFTERRLYQALGVDGVGSIQAVYVGQAPFKNPFDRTERVIFVVGFDPRSAAFNAPVSPTTLRNCAARAWRFSTPSTGRSTVRSPTRSGRADA